MKIQYKEGWDYFGPQKVYELNDSEQMLTLDIGVYNGIQVDLMFRLLPDGTLGVTTWKNLRMSDD